MDTRAPPASPSLHQLELASHRAWGWGCQEGVGADFVPMSLSPAGPSDNGGECAGHPAAAGAAIGHQQWHFLGLERAEPALVRLLSSVKLIIAISRLVLVLWDEGRDPLLVG